jgi:hypothetical protein
MPARLLRLVVAAVVTMGLVACEPAPPVRMMVAGAPSAPDAGPGERLPTATAAGTLFANVCLATAPSFVAAPLALFTEPFTQNSTTGTYYHNSLNLSFKLIDNGGSLRCSLVFAAAGDPETVYATFVAAADAQVPQSNALIVFEVRERFADGSYFHVVAAPKP